MTDEDYRLWQRASEAPTVYSEPLPDCLWCGLPMDGGPSMGGERMCAWCDCGVDRDGTRWDFFRFALVMGRGVAFGRFCERQADCIRHHEHPGECIAEQASPAPASLS